MLRRRRRVPRVLRNRIQCDLEDFADRHFASGPRRDAARRLWRFIESFGINLSGLHPDDDLAALLVAGQLDELDALELFSALRDELLVEPSVHNVRLPTFRDCVDAICEASNRRSQHGDAPVASRINERGSRRP